MVDGGLEYGVDKLPNEAVSIVCDHPSALLSPRAVCGAGEHGTSHAMLKTLNGHLTVTDPETGRGKTL